MQYSVSIAPLCSGTRWVIKENGKFISRGYLIHRHGASGTISTGKADIPESSRPTTRWRCMDNSHLSSFPLFRPPKLNPRLNIQQPLSPHTARRKHTRYPTLSPATHGLETPTPRESTSVLLLTCILLNESKLVIIPSMSGEEIALQRTCMMDIYGRSFEWYLREVLEGLHRGGGNSADEGGKWGRKQEGSWLEMWR